MKNLKHEDGRKRCQLKELIKKNPTVHKLYCQCQLCVQNKVYIQSKLYLHFIVASVVNISSVFKKKSTYRCLTSTCCIRKRTSSKLHHSNSATSFNVHNFQTVTTLHLTCMCRYLHSVTLHFHAQNLRNEFSYKAVGYRGLLILTVKGEEDEVYLLLLEQFGFLRSHT